MYKHAEGTDAIDSKLNERKITVSMDSLSLLFNW